MRRNIKLFYLFFCLLFCFSIHWSAVSLMPFADDGRLLHRGNDAYVFYSHVAHYKSSAVSQRVFNWDVIGRWDQGISTYQNLNKRYFLGIGRSGLQGGAFVKWVPISDDRYWPALGVAVGSGYRVDKFWRFRSMIDLKLHFIALYLQPFISKEFNTVIGPIIPYVALPMITQTRLSGIQTNFMVQAVLGLRGELFFIYFHKFELNVEASYGLTSADPKYVSVGIITSL